MPENVRVGEHVWRVTHGLFLPYIERTWRRNLADGTPLFVSDHGPWSEGVAIGPGGETLARTYHKHAAEAARAMDEWADARERQR